MAVQSRIHIAIRYEGLTKEQTRRIFKGFLEQYKAKNLVPPGAFDDIMKWVDRDLTKRKYDGRQIRNVVTSAMGIACADEDRRPRGITVDDLKKVDDYMYAFKTDLDYQMRQYEGTRILSLHLNYRVYDLLWQRHKPESIIHINEHLLCSHTKDLNYCVIESDFIYAILYMYLYLYCDWSFTYVHSIIESEFLILC